MFSILGGDNLSYRKLLSVFFIIILFLLSMILSLNKYTNISLFICILSSFFFLVSIKMISGSYTNITLFFVSFSILYGLSGPINAVWGDGLPDIFSKPYFTDEFLFSYSIANIGLIFGIVLYKLKNSKISHSNGNNILIRKYENPKMLLDIGMFFALLGSVFEIINLIRIGGFMRLFQGKAIYQSLTSELKLTLPSSDLMIISFSLVGLYLGFMKINKNKENINKFKIILFLVYSSPYLLIKIILGQRGLLITLFLCILIGVAYFNPIKKIKFKLVVILVIMYVFMAFLYANRSITSLILDDPNLFIEIAFQKERIVKALNPGINEFGAAFGNYSEFYSKYKTEFIPKLGKTYIKGLVLPIPSFIYPGTKPKQITYEFRDEFFPFEAKRGTIAGTGFSSILEAYMNFKHIGIFFVYFIIGYFLQKIDFYYKKKNLFFRILYVSMFSQSISFHRSAFGHIFANLILKSILICFIVLYIKVITRKNIFN